MSRILKNVHASARRLHGAGLLDGLTMREFDALCLPPLRIGELNTMSRDLSLISPLLRRYIPGTSMFNMSGQPAMLSVASQEKRIG